MEDQSPRPRHQSMLRAAERLSYIRGPPQVLADARDEVARSVRSRVELETHDCWTPEPPRLGSGGERIVITCVFQLRAPSCFRSPWWSPCPRSRPQPATRNAQAN